MPRKMVKGRAKVVKTVSNNKPPRQIDGGDTIDAVDVQAVFRALVEGEMVSTRIKRNLEKVAQFIEVRLGASNLCLNPAEVRSALHNFDNRATP